MKIVNAGLAARARPGGVKPVYDGPLGRGESRVILHVDMDCFFVSALVKNKPELRDKPVAVAHSGEFCLYQRGSLCSLTIVGGPIWGGY